MNNLKIERRMSEIQSFAKDLLRQMAYDYPELIEFFEKLDRKVDIVSQELLQEELVKVNECELMLFRNAKKGVKIAKRLEELGVEVSSPVVIKFDKDDYEKMNHGKPFVEYHLFNGCSIKKEMLTDPNNSEIRDRYNAIKIHNSNHKEEEERLKKNIAELTRKLRFTIFSRKREELSENIEMDKRKLEIIEEDRKREVHARQEAEAFEKLTPKQKEEILKYLEFTEAVSQTRALIQTHKKKISEIRRNKYQEEIIKKAFEKMKQEDGLTEENLARLNDTIKIISKSRSYLNRKVMVVTKKDNEVRKYKDIIEGFLIHLYEDKASFLGAVYSEEEDNKEL